MFDSVIFLKKNSIFDKKKIYPISCSNWSEIEGVKTDISCSHFNDSIVLEFDVDESYSIARFTNINDPVYKDSAVEFFITFDKKNYYNFEFNLAGTILAQYGENRFNRILLDVSIIKQIKTESTLKNIDLPFYKESCKWSLTVNIPKNVFYFDNIENFSNIIAFGNFYKCGDDLPNKHYLSLFPIKTDKPDFHTPQYFKEFIFE